MMRKTTVAWFVAMALCFLSAQACALTLGEPMRFGTSGYDSLDAASPVAGGGLLLAGRTWTGSTNVSYNPEEVYPWVICTDAQGNAVWEKVSDSLNRPGIIRAAATLSNGQYALVRVEHISAPNACHVLILSPDGVEEGVFRLPHAANTLAANGDGYLVSLYEWGGVRKNSRIPYVARMNAAGETLWTQSFDELPFGGIYGLYPISEESVIMTGRMHETEDGLYQGFVARLDGREITWIFKTSGESGNDFVSDCAPLEDGILAIAVQHTPVSNMEDGNAPLSQMSVMLLDTSGKPIWEKPLPSPSMGRHVVQIATWKDGLITASNTQKSEDATEEYIQYDLLDMEGNLLDSMRTAEMENSGMTVRFVQGDDGRLYLYGSSVFEGKSEFFVMEVLDIR